MPTREELLAEGYRRGILPPDMKSAYEEAMRRGIVPNAGAPESQPEASAMAPQALQQPAPAMPEAIEEAAPTDFSAIPSQTMQAHKPPNWPMAQAHQPAPPQPQWTDHMAGLRESLLGQGSNVTPQGAAP
jgi:hypothetical protein